MARIFNMKKSRGHLITVYLKIGLVFFQIFNLNAYYFNLMLHYSEIHRDENSAENFPFI